MKFHLHVVDGNAASSPASSPRAAAGTSESSAVLLFAHLTLRCGHLNDVVAVSASTTPAAVRQAQLLQQQAHGTAAAGTVSGHAISAAHARRAGADGTESEDTQVLQAAGAVLAGLVDTESEQANTLPYATLADGAHAVIQQYAYFTTPFAVAEQSLRATIAAAADARLTQAATAASLVEPPPYFDLVATTDMGTFEYVLDYYQQLRARYGGSACRGRGTKPVGVLHIVAEDPSRAARVLQRVLEMVLKRSGWDFSVDANAEDAGEDDNDELTNPQGRAEEEEEEEAGGGAGATADAKAGGAVRRGGKADSWVNHIDEAVHVFAQLFGVDVLVALV